MSATCRFQVFHPAMPASTCEQRLTIATDAGTIPLSELAAALAIPPHELASRVRVYRSPKRTHRNDAYCYVFNQQNYLPPAQQREHTDGDRALAKTLGLDLENYPGGRVALVLYLQLPLEIRDPHEHAGNALRQTQERAARFLASWPHAC